jgi:ABC-type branched-subunit amino acid transport system permease subunit
MAIMLIAVESLRFIATMGRWSFTHAAMMGIGGYTTAILTQRFDWPFGATWVLGGLVAAFMGLIISYPTLRTSGIYFFMSTLVVGTAIQWVWQYFPDPFGGVRGIQEIRLPHPFDSSLVFSYLVLLIALVSLVIFYGLEKSRLNSILKSIASQDCLARSVGINVLRYETLGFVIGCFFAGMAGVLYVDYAGFCYPNDFGMSTNVSLIVFAAVGGVGNFWGPLIGTSFLMVIGETIRAYRELVPLIYGVILVITVVGLPDGLISLPLQISAWRQGHAHHWPVLKRHR